MPFTQEEIDRVTLDKTLGIEFVEVAADRLVAEMPVTERVMQPFGYLHGGASVALAESVASVGGFINAGEGKLVFGLEINANHIRPVQSGKVRATGTPIHVGRTTQVWEIRIEDEDDRLVCISRCTLAVVDRP